MVPFTKLLRRARAEKPAKLMIIIMMLSSMLEKSLVNFLAKMLYPEKERAESSRSIRPLRLLNSKDVPFIRVI